MSKFLFVFLVLSVLSWSADAQSDNSIEQPKITLEQLIKSLDRRINAKELSSKELLNNQVTEKISPDNGESAGNYDSSALESEGASDESEIMVGHPNPQDQTAPTENPKRSFEEDIPKIQAKLAVGDQTQIDEKRELLDEV